MFNKHILILNKFKIIIINYIQNKTWFLFKHSDLPSVGRPCISIVTIPIAKMPQMGDCEDLQPEGNVSSDTLSVLNRNSYSKYSI